MKSPLNDGRIKTLLSYFLLAVTVIIAYKFIMGIDVILNLVNRFLNIISPFIIGFLIAYILNIPCDSIQRLLKGSKYKFICSKRKALSIILVYLLAFLIIFLILRIIIPALYSSVSIFLSNFNYYYKSTQDLIDSINDLDILNTDISIDKILNTVREFTLQKLPLSLNMLFDFSSGLLNGFIAFISSIYILLEKENFKRYLNRLLNALLPPKGYNLFLKYIKKLNTNFKQYIYTQTVDGCILGTIVVFELLILKSPYALVLGVMLGVVNYIPYFGSIIGTIFAILVVAFTQDIMVGIVAAAILLITQQIDANIIQPRLMSGSFSLSPLLVIISITIGGAISGILGMIMAIPIVAVIKDMFDEIIAYYESLKSGDKRMD